LFKGRYGHSACYYKGADSIIIYGGSEEKQKDDIVRFDLATNSFYKIKEHNQEDKPSSRDFHCGIVAESSLYIIGVR
jgi:hypothetical protein